MLRIMIKYDLKCRRGHVFEAWFRDSAAYDEQVEASKVACPDCGARKVEKAVMAPRLARGAEKAIELRRALADLRAKVEADCDYVGPQFAEEARRIHYGEAAARGIYGETSSEEAEALAEEGVPFARIPWLPKDNA
jgi:hypothetical protein